jgi:hypothetical protein
LVFILMISLFKLIAATLVVVLPISIPITIIIYLFI